MGRSFLRFRPAYLLLAAAALVVALHFLAMQADRRSQLESYPKDNYSFIEDGLCVGGILSEVPRGVQAVLNVCETEDPYEAEVHRWEPIPDLGPAPGIAWLRAQVEFIDAQQKAGRSVYVHCRAGVNRSAMVAAAYLMWRDRLTRDHALAAIRSKRPRIQPFKVYQTYLLEWEKSLTEKATTPSGGIMEANCGQELPRWVPGPWELPLHFSHRAASSA